MNRGVPAIGLAPVLGCVIAAAMFWVSKPAVAGPLEDVRNSVVSVLPVWPSRQMRIEEPEGSGVVIGDGQTIITALHVVDKALSLRVRTFAGEIFDAEISGRDKATDVAVLRVAKPLKAIKPSESSLEIGERVCAVGNSFGLGLSVTCGVVSGVHKAGVGFNSIEDFVQTDAAVNPGASGGALVNMSGEFVGLLSAIFTKKSDANIGVNFAVSSPLALKTAQLLQSNQRIVWPSPGLGLASSPKKGGTGKMGAEIVSIRPGSAGANADLERGDLIVSAQGWRIRSPADFRSVLASRVKSDRIKLLVVREGRERNIELDLKTE